MVMIARHYCCHGDFPYNFVFFNSFTPNNINMKILGKSLRSFYIVKTKRIDHANVLQRCQPQEIECLDCSTTPSSISTAPKCCKNHQCIVLTFFVKKKKRTLIGKKIAYIPNLSQKTSKFNFISESWRSEWETVRFCAKSRILSGTLGELAYNGNAQVEVFVHRFVTKF